MTTRINPTAVKRPRTIVVWTDTDLIVEFVVATEEDAALRAQTLTDGDEEEMCWQVLEGHARVTVRTSGKEVRRVV